MTDHDAIWDYRDGQQAQRLAEVFGDEGWIVEWARADDGWEASLSGPPLPGRSVGRGRSRVAAISRAHVLAFRRLRLGDSAPISQGLDPEAGIVSAAPCPAEPVASI